MVADEVHGGEQRCQSSSPVFNVESLTVVNGAAPPLTSSAPSTIPLEDRKKGLEVIPGKSHIGDRMRSPSSASTFFRSVDKDGDGTLRGPELATFVRETIGGSAFDTQPEVDAEVDSVMKTLDRNHDDALDTSDLFAYWMQLESLLTSDEVADWVVYAVQLPEYVGKIFKENVVTGYDFPELVENDGDSVLTELHIEKPSFRKKIVRHINARMLGIGMVPEPPSGIRHTLESCSTVSFSWEKSTARGFPVHSYRVQRRAVELHDGIHPRQRYANQSKGTKQSGTFPSGADSDIYATKKDGPGAPEVGLEACTTLESRTLSEQHLSASSGSLSASDWVTVYCGGENEFVDTGLELGHNYVYRFQAWNSVGRSVPWVTIDISPSLEKQKCTKTSSKNLNINERPEVDLMLSLARGPWAFLEGSYFLANFIVTFIRGVLALAAFAAALMRFRRASATSTTATKMEPLFPWLWKGLNSFALRAFNVEVIPKSLLGDREWLRRQNSLHDLSVGAVGLNGYKSFGECVEVPKNRRVMFREKSLSTGDLRKALEGQKTPSRAKAVEPAPPILRRSNRASSDVSASEGKSETGAKKVRSTASKMAWRSKRHSSFNSADEVSERGTPDVLNGEIVFHKGPLPETSSSTLPTRESSTISDDSDSGWVAKEYEDDNNRCNTCRKRFKFGKRWRHHCARCLSSFCHKHGRTTHSNMTSCRVPGTCVCNVCLELEQFNKKDAKQEVPAILNLAKE